MLGHMKALLLKVRHVIRSYIDCWPCMYLALCRLRPKTRQITLSKGTEIVIEGYPRSANTFAVAAFTFAQGRPVKIARHLHAASQVIAGVKMGIPTLVLIRQPEQAVLSLLVRAPHITAKQALRDYIRFYKSILPYCEGYVVADFEEVTGNFGRVIQRINDRFGTNFRVFEHTEENLKKVFQIVEEMDKQDTGLPEVKEETVARPSAERERLKMLMREKLKESGMSKLLHEAQELYRTFTLGEGQRYLSKESE